MSAPAATARRDGEAPVSDAVDDLAIFRTDTSTAFLVAPAVPAALVAALAAVAAICTDGLACAPIAFWLVFLALAFGGYMTALIVGVPVYLLLRLRGRPVPSAGAMLVGGMVAALPWTVLAIAGRDQAFFLFASAVFGLGCIGGLVFSVVRDGSRWRTGP